MTPAPEDPARSVPDPDTVPTTVLRRHAAPPPTRPSGGPFVIPALVALFAIVTLVGAWKTLQGHDTSGVAPGGSTPVASASHPSPTGTPGTGSPGPRPSSTPSDSATPVPSGSARPDPSTRPARDRSVPVVVLNATSRTGLAAAEAARLRSKGWRVTAVGNWRSGGVTRTTVFSTRHPVATRTLRHDARVPGPARRPLPGMPTGGLVLVLSP